jgi:hypothetical protein
MSPRRSIRLGAIALGLLLAVACYAPAHALAHADGRSHRCGLCYLAATAIEPPVFALEPPSLAVTLAAPPVRAKRIVRIRAARVRSRGPPLR